VAALLTVILDMVHLDVTRYFDCQTEVIFLVFFASLSIASASFLVVLRIIAVWEKNRFVVGGSLVVWATNVAFLIHASAKLRSVFSPQLGNCISLNIGSDTTYLIAMLVTDTILLLTVLVGLLRLRRNGGGRFGLGQLLWTQGVIWLLFSLASEIPPVVLISLNLNEAIDAMFQLPLLVVLTITATRMHRTLVDYALRSSETRNGQRKTDGNAASKDEQNPTVSARFEQRGVRVHTVYEEYPTPQMGPHSSYNHTDGHLSEKPPGLCPEQDLERGTEN